MEMFTVAVTRGQRAEYGEQIQQYMVREENADDPDAPRTISVGRHSLFTTNVISEAIPFPAYLTHRHAYVLPRAC
jgi:hypothetical protein